MFDLVEIFLPKDIAVAAAVTDSADGNADPSAATDSTATKPTRPEFGCAIPVEVLLALTGENVFNVLSRTKLVNFPHLNTDWQRANAQRLVIR